MCGFIYPQQLVTEFHSSYDVQPAGYDASQTTRSVTHEVPSDSLLAGSDKVYSCTICNKTFRRAFSLERHFMIHSGARPFQCSYCPYKANQKTVLQKHLLRIHKILPDGGSVLWINNCVIYDRIQLIRSIYYYYFHIDHGNSCFWKWIGLLGWHCSFDWPFVHLG